MKDVFIITCDWNNNESYAEDRWDSSDVVGVFETFEDAQNAFDDILKQRQEHIDKINAAKRVNLAGFTIKELKIVNIKRKPGYMYFAVENDEYCDEYSNNAYRINKFTLGQIEKYDEAYGIENKVDDYFKGDEEDD